MTKLLKAIGGVDGLELVTSDEEVLKLVLDREARRSRRIKMIEENIENLGALKLEVLLLLFSIATLIRASRYSLETRCCTLV
jgi:hypothetical protein